MKKMRGIAAPLTLGFILTALIAATGVNKAAKPEPVAKAPVAVTAPAASAPALVVVAPSDEQ